MKPGSLVRLVKPPIQNQVDIGALAKVVDGQSAFPNLYKKLLSKIGSKDAKQFVWIKWVKDPKFWRGQPDGAYASFRFVKVLRNVINTGRKVLN